MDQQSTTILTQPLDFDATAPAIAQQEELDPVPLAFTTNNKSPAFAPGSTPTFGPTRSPAFAPATPDLDACGKKKKNKLLEEADFSLSTTVVKPHYRHTTAEEETAQMTSETMQSLNTGGTLNHDRQLYHQQPHITHETTGIGDDIGDV